MRCVQCESNIPEGADYCIYCGAQVLQTSAAREGEPAGAAATGPTIDLGRSPRPLAPVPAPALEPVTSSRPHHRQRPPYSGRAGLWLVLGAALLCFTLGLGFLAVLGGLLARVLAVFSLPLLLLALGLVSFRAQARRGRRDRAMRSLLWLGGLAVLLATKLFWPGIVVLVGLSILLQSRRGRCC